MRRLARRYWLTIALRAGSCDRCASPLEVGAEVVFRASPRETLCLECAERLRIEARPSRRYREARRSGPVRVFNVDDLAPEQRARYGV
jgi:RNase P subunit RPR2